MAPDWQSGTPPPRPRHFDISLHAEDRMWERGIMPEDLTAILRDDPLIEWQDEERPPAEALPRSSEPFRLRMTGRGMQPRVLTAILEAPDEDGFSAVITVFDADPADQRRYRRHKQRRGRI